MARRAEQAAAEGLAELRQRIEHWRRTRARRTAMPAELWSEAVALARSLGPYPVARTLGVNFDGLRRRMLEPEAAAAGGFVELSGAAILASSPTGIMIEVADAAGARLTLRLPPETPVDVAGVVGAFIGRAP